MLTGGEPLLFSELIPLCGGLRAAWWTYHHRNGRHFYLPLECELLSINPKLANSTPSATQAGKWQLRHERSRFAPEVIHRLIGEHEYQFKFVIDQPADCGEVEALLAPRFPQIDREPRDAHAARHRAKSSFRRPASGSNRTAANTVSGSARASRLSGTDSYAGRKTRRCEKYFRV